VGAIGVMQVMPPTGKELNERRNAAKAEVAKRQ
jgi:soluble lytic murein transglycosylase-like protein